MKCKIIKPLLGLKCNIYDSVFERKFEVLMLLSLQVVSGVQIKKKQETQTSAQQLKHFLHPLYSSLHSIHIKQRGSANHTSYQTS